MSNMHSIRLLLGDVLATVPSKSHHMDDVSDMLATLARVRKRIEAMCLCGREGTCDGLGRSRHHPADHR